MLHALTINKGSIQCATKDICQNYKTLLQRILKSSLQCIDEHLINFFVHIYENSHLMASALTILFCPCLTDTDPSTFLKKSSIVYFSCELSHSFKSTPLAFKIDHMLLLVLHSIKLKKESYLEIQNKNLSYFSAKKVAL